MPSSKWREFTSYCLLVRAQRGQGVKVASTDSPVSTARVLHAAGYPIGSPSTPNLSVAQLNTKCCRGSRFPIRGAIQRPGESPSLIPIDLAPRNLLRLGEGIGLLVTGRQLGPGVPGSTTDSDRRLDMLDVCDGAVCA